jgi:hypothetical protein
MSIIIAPNIDGDANGTIFTNTADTFYSSYQTQVLTPFTRESYPLAADHLGLKTKFNITTTSNDELVYYKGATLPTTDTWILVSVVGPTNTNLSHMVNFARVGASTEFELTMKAGENFVEEGTLIITISLMDNETQTAQLSVTTTTVDPTIQFILESLVDDSLIAQLATDPTYGGITQLDVTGMDATATLDLPAANFNNLFFFRTDDDDVADDDDDIVYRTDPAAWNAGNVIPFSDATVAVADLVGGDNAAALTLNTLQYDFVRHMAASITGGYSSTDIFSNETDLRNSVAATDNSIKTSIEAGLATGGTTSVPLISANHTKENVSRTILLRLLGGNVFTQSRVHAVMHNRTSASAWLYVPFMAGDSFVVKVNYTPNTDTPLGENVITPRSYKIVLRLV